MNTSYYLKGYLFLIGLIISFVVLSCQKNDDIMEENIQNTINKKISATIIDPVEVIGCHLSDVEST